LLGSLPLPLAVALWQRKLTTVMHVSINGDFMNDIRAAIYARKSTESIDRQIASIGDQIKEVKPLVDRDGAALVVQLKESQSASKLGRPVFNDLMEKVESGEINRIYCWKADRLARNPVDGATVRWAIKQGKLVVVTPQQIYSRNTDANLLLSFEFIFSEKYTDDLSRNVKRGNRGKLDRGEWCGVAPIGYLNKLDDHTIVPDPDRFHKVRELWDMRLKGMSVQDIRIAAKDKLDLRTMRRKRVGGNPVQMSTLYRMFKNPFYYGLIKRHHDGKLYQVPGAHEPMITKEEFLKVQNLFGDKKIKKTTRKPFSFTGIISCGECGCMVTAEEKVKTNGKKYTYYRCTKRKQDVRCSQRTIRLEDLEDQITEVLESITIPSTFVSWALDVLKSRNKEMVQINKNQLANLQRQYSMIDRQLDTLLDMRLDDSISDEMFCDRKNKIESRRSDLKKKMHDLESNSDQWRSVCERTFVFAKSAKDDFDSGSHEVKRQIFSTIGSNFVLKDRCLSVELKPYFELIAEKRREAKRLELPILGLNKTKKQPLKKEIVFWQGRQDSNLQPTVLETATLPIELLPYPHRKLRKLFHLRLPDCGARRRTDQYALLRSSPVRHI
jgi:site-specific DNA recombinase